MIDELVLYVYGRPRCHLCDAAKAAVREALRGRPVRVVERNVEDDPAWEERFGSEVPVGVLRGRKVFKYRVDGARLRRAVENRLAGTVR